MTTSLARPSVLSRALVVVAGAVAALVVWLLAVPLLGVDLSVVQFGATQPVTPVLMIVSGLIGGLLGWGLLALLERRARNGRRLWIRIAVVLTVLSFVSPIMAAANTATALTLCLAHVAVALVVIPGLTRGGQ